MIWIMGAMPVPPANNPILFTFLPRKRMEPSWNLRRSPPIAHMYMIFPGRMQLRTLVMGPPFSSTLHRMPMTPSSSGPVMGLKYEYEVVMYCSCWWWFRLLR